VNECKPLGEGDYNDDDDVSLEYLAQRLIGENHRCRRMRRWRGGCNT